MAVVLIDELDAAAGGRRIGAEAEGSAEEEDGIGTGTGVGATRFMNLSPRVPLLSARAVAGDAVDMVDGWEEKEDGDEI